MADHSIARSIAPLVLIVVAGVVSGRTGVLPSTLRKALSDFCFYFGMPALLVRTIVTAPNSSRLCAHQSASNILHQEMNAAGTRFIPLDRQCVCPPAPV